MPYIKQKEREFLAKWLDGLNTVLVDMTNKGKKNNGIVCYVLYKILVDVYANSNYEVMSNALKVLESAKLEFYRKIMAPYEEKKMMDIKNVKFKAKILVK